MALLLLFCELELKTKWIYKEYKHTNLIIAFTTEWCTITVANFDSIPIEKVCNNYNQNQPERNLPDTNCIISEQIKNCTLSQIQGNGSIGGYRDFPQACYSKFQ